mmetsp:Transcript_22280/g.42011  ORF Transcript_22280/g.42011 Transcript_22280/m.42011 type:complete len:173 (+) Transcript_22280:186-704(+)
MSFLSGFLSGCQSRKRILNSFARCSLGSTFCSSVNLASTRFLACAVSGSSTAAAGCGCAETLAPAAPPAAAPEVSVGASDVNLPFFFFLRLLLEELLLDGDDLRLELLLDFFLFFRLLLRFLRLEGLLLRELFCDDLLEDLLDEVDGVLDGLDSSESRRRLGFLLPRHRRSL